MSVSEQPLSATERQAAIHTLWDALADLPQTPPDEALQHLLAELCRLLGASNAVWTASLRLGDKHASDPLRGWRLRASQFLHPAPKMELAVREYARRFERHVPDLITVRFYSEAGTFRAHRMRDMVEPAWFEGDYYHWFFREGLSCVDGLRLGIPVNADAEAGFAILRDEKLPPFTLEDCALAFDILRGTRWFQRQQLLGRGLLLADEPLTPTEQRTLSWLLEGKADKEIAAAMNQRLGTTHEYVRRIYRKFGVGGRAELMALWLGTLRRP
jgi:DNA-binding CsgD family transcriptional regulator